MQRGLKSTDEFLFFSGGFGGGLMSDNLFCDVEDPMVPTSSAERTNSFSLTSLDVHQEEDWTLPSEAFQPRHEIQDRSPPPEEFSSTHAEIHDAGKFTMLISTRNVKNIACSSTYILTRPKGWHLWQKELSLSRHN